MAHLIDTMAYTGQTPWHGLGNVLPPQQSLDIWLQAAGMDWTIEQSDVMFNVASDALHIRPYSDSKVLYRSDTLAPLSVVSNRYNVVQPHEVLHFYQDLVEAGGFELETAGSLKGGRKLWALAKTGQDLKLAGGDLVKSYLLLATSCDGTLCTTVQFTSLRVVCNNTLQMALRGATGAIKVPHSTQFDATAVKESLGLGLSHWDEFRVQTKALTQRPVAPKEALRFSATCWRNRRMRKTSSSLARYYDCMSSIRGQGWARSLPAPAIPPGGWSMLSVNTWITIAVLAARTTGSIPPGLGRAPNSNLKPWIWLSRYCNSPT
ncbi:DUF932 domain-containing protein [Aeromonas veronii]